MNNELIRHWVTGETASYHSSKAIRPIITLKSGLAVVKVNDGTNDIWKVN